jgi:hypothetical protein
VLSVVFLLQNLRTKRNGSAATIASSVDECGSGAIYPADANLYSALVRAGGGGPTPGGVADPLRARAASAARGTGGRLQALFSPFAKVR